MKQASSSSKLIKIRREQRTKQLQQLRTAYRFINLGKEQIQFTSPQDSYQYLTQFTLQEILREGQLQNLYRVVVQLGFEAEEIIQRRALDILHFLQGKLSTPKGALTVANLINRFQVWAELAYKQNVIAKIIEHMSHLHPSSEGQAIYQWVICAATQRPGIVDIQQLKPFLPILQQLLRFLYLNNQKQDYILIQLIKNLSQLQITLSQDTIIFFTEYYWKVHNQAALVNIYLTCSNLLAKMTFRPSTKVIIHLVIIYLKGRTKITINLDSYVAQVYKMLLTVLRGYKQRAQLMFQEQIQLKDAIISTTLHSFLLNYQSQLFTKSQYSISYLLFLSQFCMQSPVQQTIRKWFQLGTIQHILSFLTISPQVCEQGLKILYTLAYRAKQEDKDTNLLAAVKSYCKIEYTVSQALESYSSSKLAELANQVLFAFSKKF